MKKISTLYELPLPEGRGLLDRIINNFRNMKNKDINRLAIDFITEHWDEINKKEWEIKDSKISFI